MKHDVILYYLQIYFETCNKQERKSDAKKNESENVTYGSIDMLWSKLYIQAHSISIYQKQGNQNGTISR